MAAILPYVANSEFSAFSKLCEFQYSVHVCKTGVCVAYEEKFQPINKFNTRVTAHPKLKVCVLAPLRKSITFYTYSIKYLNKETLLHCYCNPNAYFKKTDIYSGPFTLDHDSIETRNVANLKR